MDTALLIHIELKIHSEWGNKCFHSFGTSNSRVVSIIISNKLEYKVHGSLSDKNGNFLELNLTEINDFNKESIILCG